MNNLTASELFKKIQKSTFEKQGVDFSYIKLLNSEIASGLEGKLREYGIDSNAAKKTIERNQELLNKYPKPSEFQLDGPYLILAKRVDTLVQQLEYKNIQLPQITFGTLPHGVLNAYSVKVTSDSYLIIFQEGIFNYLNLITKIIAQLLDPSEHKLQFGVDYSLKKIQQSPEIFFRTSDLFESYVIYGDPKYALPYWTDFPESNGFEYILELGEMFLVAHEYAHIQLEHLDSRNNSESSEFEFRADEKAFELLLKTLPENNSKAYALFAVSVMFYSLHLIEGSVGLVLFGDKVVKDIMDGDSLLWRYNKYPSFLERMRNLQDVFINQGDKEYLIFYPLLLETSYLFNALWQLMVPKLVDYHKKGIKPHISHLPEHLSLNDSKKTKKLPDFWIKKIIQGLYTTDNLKPFFLSHLSHFVIETPFIVYNGLLDEDKDWADICKKFLVEVQPFYINYYPRLIENLTSMQKAGREQEYILHISSNFQVDLFGYLEKETGKPPFSFSRF